MRPEGEGDGGEDADEGGDVIPSRHGLEIKERKHHEYYEGDDFLDDLQLVGGVRVVAPAVGRDHEKIFKESDAPAREDDQPERRGFEFRVQVAIPRERHENVRADEQHDGQPAGLNNFIHGAKMKTPSSQVKLTSLP